MQLSEKRKLTILGSTGSIGVQTLEVIESLPEAFEIEFLTSNSRIDILIHQIEKYSPKGVVVNNPEACDEIRKKTDFEGAILCGEEGLRQAAAFPDNDLVVSALVGFSGVIPTLAAIEMGTTVALANKETLVSAGHVIKEAAKENNVEIIAIDSEHSAILQCLTGEHHDEVEKLILTASGGPFLDTPLDRFMELSVEQALDHPNWSMGSKITIDSATMMNKGFEVIEAFWLFEVEHDDIDVVVHPQSIIHSMVQFIDGSVKAQLGLPDMRIPISYALTFPRRRKYDFPRMDLTDIATLTFRKPDFERYPCLKLAFDSIELGGTAPAIVNAANEIAVREFLAKKIKFTGIAENIDKTLRSMKIVKDPNLVDVIEADKQAREICEELIREK